MEYFIAINYFFTLQSSEPPTYLSPLLTPPPLLKARASSRFNKHCEKGTFTGLVSNFTLSLAFEVKACNTCSLRRRRYGLNFRPQRMRRLGNTTGK